MAKTATPSITQSLSESSPLLLECKKPQIMFVPSQNYGVRKLWKRLNDSKNR